MFLRPCAFTKASLFESRKVSDPSIQKEKREPHYHACHIESKARKMTKDEKSWNRTLSGEFSPFPLVTDPLAYTTFWHPFHCHSRRLFFCKHSIWSASLLLTTFLASSSTAALFITFFWWCGLTVRCPRRFWSIVSEHHHPRYYWCLLSLSRRVGSASWPSYLPYPIIMLQSWCNFANTCSDIFLGQNLDTLLPRYVNVCREIWGRCLSSK